MTVLQKDISLYGVEVIVVNEGNKWFVWESE